MAHFRGEVAGQRGTASRLGSRVSGLRTTAASWEGAVEVTLTRDESASHDVAEVWLIPWFGKGIKRLLYSGPVGSFRPWVIGGEQNVR